jgi:hypothetical protein
MMVSLINKPTITYNRQQLGRRKVGHINKSNQEHLKKESESATSDYSARVFFGIDDIDSAKHYSKSSSRSKCNQRN